MKYQNKSISLESTLVKKIDELRKKQNPQNNFSLMLSKLAWLGLKAYEKGKP